MSNPDHPGEIYDLERTWLVSVLFADMVKYSQQSQETQAQWRHRFKGYVSDALKNVQEQDRVILDCGDGAAIVFLGDPEAAMMCALSVMGRIVGETGPPKPMRVRIGINLGSVRLVRDINGNMAAAGDGINVGQRVMSFASDNQILVSRSYYEVASLLTEDYAALFHLEAPRKDKHQREHMLYQLHLPGENHSFPVTNTQIIRRIAPQFAEHIATVEKNLALVVGPIARRLVQGVGNRAHSADEIREYLLAFIPDQTGRDRFLKSCEGMFSPPPTSEEDTIITLAPASAPLPPKKPAPILEAAVLERASRDLALFMGPMAKLLVHQAATRVQSRQDLYQALAAEIPSAVERQKFLKNGLST